MTNRRTEVCLVFIIISFSPTWEFDGVKRNRDLDVGSTSRRARETYLHKQVSITIQDPSESDFLSIRMTCICVLRPDGQFLRGQWHPVKVNEG